MVAEADFELVLDKARELFRRNRSGGARGQQITCADSEDYWLVSVAYELGRQHQRESDAALCDYYGDSSNKGYQGQGCNVAAEAIRKNTGDPKCQNPK